MATIKEYMDKRKSIISNHFINRVNPQDVENEIRRMVKENRINFVKENNPNLGTPFEMTKLFEYYCKIEKEIKSLIIQYIKEY